MYSNDVAHAVSAILGNMLSVLLCGLIPLHLGRNRDLAHLGEVGLGFCIMSGYVHGPLGALAMAMLMSLVIVAAGRLATGLWRWSPIPAESR